MHDRLVPPRLTFSDRLAIRWRHRRVLNPKTWRNRVQFDEMVAADHWDLAPNIDELNERYEYYRLQPWERAEVEQSKPIETDPVADTSSDD